MRRPLSIPTLALLFALAVAVPAQAASPAQGNFGLHGFEVAFTDEDGLPEKQAGSHPFAVTLSLAANVDGEEGFPEGRLRDLIVEQIPGLLGDATAYPTCSTLQFLQGESEPACPKDTAIGITANLTTDTGPTGLWAVSPIYNVAPPPGSVLRLGFAVETARVIVDVGLSEEHPNSAISATRNVSQVLDFYANKTELWGDPSDPRHNELRGICGSDLNVTGPPPAEFEDFEFEGDGDPDACGVEPNPKPLLTLPTFCAEPLTSAYEALSWEGPSLLDDGEDANKHEAPAFTGCGKLPFKPQIAATPSTKAAQSPTGLELEISVDDEGLTSVSGESQSRIRDVIFTLPEGMTANPSVAEGLEVCSEDDLDHETLAAKPGQGCPQGSKLGTLEVQSPLVSEPLNGSLYIAEPFKNPFDTLIAFYLVVRNENLGILVKQPTRVQPDPKTGQLIGIAEDIPPTAAFSSFRLRLREGARSPLISPPTCGKYEVQAELHPWSGTAPLTATSSFQVISGPNESPCPQGGTPPFEPGFEAGSQNNAAGRFSPFTMRLTRRDGDQDLTRFDATLPPGVLAKLAGVSQCTNSQIATAKAKTGKQELAEPSCPANSKIGTAIGGAGVGSQLTYVKGSLHLAGPFAGAPLSVVGIVPAVAGPFDVGTVVVRQALDVNPRSGIVSADGAKSDPIPHILAGIPLSVREIQVHVDRPDFTLNPTSCNPFATTASIWGGGADPFALADNSPVSREARYQAADCARLGFKPKLNIRLKGGTKRGAHPAQRGVFRPRAGDANLQGLVLRLPRSAFLDQAHIRTICTRVQFAANNCPRGAEYGWVRAFTPLLAAPLEGPAYLRSSDNELPDLVFALKGLVDFEAVARVDSKRGGIRLTFTALPDAPIEKVIVSLQGGKKGLIVNSTDLCKRRNRANLRLNAHNGAVLKQRPLVRAVGCGRK